jgi:hypothetical protein
VTFGYAWGIARTSSPTLHAATIAEVQVKRQAFAAVDGIVDGIPIESIYNIQ